MAAPVCGIITTAVGAILLVVFAIVGYVVVPDIIENIIVDQVSLIENTIQMDRFERIPFPLEFKVRIFNVTNSDEILTGNVPIVREVGPYVYSLQRERIIDDITENTISYKILDIYEFNAEASYPYTEDDMVSIINVPFHAILQMAESVAPTLMSVLNLALNRIFGEYSTPYVQYSVKDLLWDGIDICSNPGLTGLVPCNLIRDSSETSDNLNVMEDGTVVFSLLSYKNVTPSNVYEVHRGTEEVSNLGIIIKYDDEPRLNEWIDERVDENDFSIPSVCNELKGTDSAIFPPFVNSSKALHAHNPDICRTVELRYERDEVYEEINVYRYSVGEWFLDNNEGCYCINQTLGITQPDGCLYRGAMELYTCVGAFMVLSLPHFLYSDYEYRNGVFGLTPNEEDHKIILDIEPISGTVIRGAKRAQFNVFSRPISGIPSTQQLLPTLMPIFWVEESVSLPDEYVQEVLSRLQPLQLVEILRIVFIVLSALVLVLGAILIVRHCTKKTEGIIGLGGNSQLEKISE